LFKKAGRVPKTGRAVLERVKEMGSSLRKGGQALGTERAPVVVGEKRVKTGGRTCGGGEKKKEKPAAGGGGGGQGHPPVSGVKARQLGVGQQWGKKCQSQKKEENFGTAEAQFGDRQAELKGCWGQSFQRG